MAEHDRQVSTLARELRFFPSDVRDGASLKAQDVAIFNELGYLSGIQALAPDEVARIRDGFDALLTHFIASGRDGYAIDRYQDRIALIHDIALHPRILDAVSDLLGPDVVCWATHFFCKMPGDPRRISWHQDCSYWALSPSKTVTVWLAIDDVDEDNGCMQCIPASHLHGHLPWRETDDGDANVLTQVIDDIGRLGTPVNIELAAGEMSLHSDLLVHGSHPNMSARRRCGLTLRYCPPDVRAYWGWNEHSIICRGSDSSGHWVDVPRPPDGAALEFRADGA